MSKITLYGKSVLYYLYLHLQCHKRHYCIYLFTTTEYKDIFTVCITAKAALIHNLFPIKLTNSYITTINKSLYFINYVIRKKLTYTVRHLTIRNVKTMLKAVVSRVMS